jgi:hypothetical protein
MEASRTGSSTHPCTWVTLPEGEGLGIHPGALLSDNAPIGEAPQCCSNCYPQLLERYAALSLADLASRRFTKQNNSHQVMEPITNQHGWSQLAASQGGVDDEQGWGSQPAPYAESEGTVNGVEESEPDGEGEVEEEGVGVGGVTGSNLLPGVKHSVLDASRNELHEQVLDWRKEKARTRRSWSKSLEAILPTKMVKNLLDNCGRFLGDNELATPRSLKAVMRWDLALPTDLESLTQVVNGWIPSATLVQTPRRGGKRKQPRTGTPTHDQRHHFEEGLATPSGTSSFSSQTTVFDDIPSSNLDNSLASLFSTPSYKTTTVQPDNLMEYMAAQRARDATYYKSRQHSIPHVNSTFTSSQELSSNQGTGFDVFGTRAPSSQNMKQWTSLPRTPLASRPLNTIGDFKFEPSTPVMHNNFKTFTFIEERPGASTSRASANKRKLKGSKMPQ